ncbi:MAG: hypothetical protein QXQ02_01815 [Halobacteria archaeon]
MGRIDQQRWEMLLKKEYDRCQKCSRELKNLDKERNGFSVYCDACDLGYYVGRVMDVYYERFYTYREVCAICSKEILKEQATMHFLESIVDFKYNVYALGVCENCKQSQFYKKLEKVFLDEDIKAKLIFQARQIFAKLKSSKKFKRLPHETLVEISLKLACDENGCIAPFEPKMSYLTQARKIIGIRQRMTPVEYTEAQMMILARRNEELSVHSFKIESLAKEILSKLKPIGHNPAVLSAAAIYLSSEGLLSQREIEKALNISQVSISNISRKMKAELKLERGGGG